MSNIKELKSFVNYIAEIFPNDTAIKEGYSLEELKELYDDLYIDFKNGVDTSFAKAFYKLDLDDCEFRMVRKLWDIQKAEIDELKAKLRSYEIDSNQLLTERDEMQEFAEQLKNRLQEVFNQDFGDHSNANCPFTNSLEYDDSGFVLMPKEPTLKMSVAYELNSIAPISKLSVQGYKAMIKAVQENSNG